MWFKIILRLIHMNVVYVVKVSLPTFVRGKTGQKKSNGGPKDILRVYFDLKL